MQGIVHAPKCEGVPLVALVADLVKCELVVLDANIAVNTTEQMEEVVGPFCALLPLLLGTLNNLKILGRNLIQNGVGEG